MLAVSFAPAFFAAVFFAAAFFGAAFFGAAFFAAAFFAAAFFGAAFFTAAFFGAAFFTAAFFGAVFFVGATFTDAARLPTDGLDFRAAVFFFAGAALFAAFFFGAAAFWVVVVLEPAFFLAAAFFFGAAFLPPAFSFGVVGPDLRVGARLSDGRFLAPAAFFFGAAAFFLGAAFAAAFRGAALVVLVDFFLVATGVPPALGWHDDAVERSYLLRWPAVAQQESCGEARHLGWTEPGMHEMSCLAIPPRFVFFDAMPKPLSSTDFVRQMRRRGATRLERVTFRKNRSTIWSLTRRGTALNLHEAFRTAPSRILDAFAVIVRSGGLGTPRSKKAGEAILAWPELTRALEQCRATRARRRRSAEAHCCGTPEQREYLRTLYRYFNETRFAGALPADLPLRLSNRMRTSLGHMMPGEGEDGRRYVTEIALNVDLMLAGNGAERVDTLLHEMAHAADYLHSGNRGHGASWRAWARRVGCRPTTLYDRPVVRRRRRRMPVTRVPPLPLALRRRVA